MKRFLTLTLALMFVLVLAACGKDEKKDTTNNETTTPTTTEPAVAEPITIKQVMDSEDDTTVKTEGIVVGYGDGNYLTRGAAYIYSPTEELGIYVIFATDTENFIEVGQKVSITGTKDSYQGLPQITNYTFEVLEEDIDVTQYYEEVTIEELTTNVGTVGSKDGYVLKPVLIKNAVVASNPDKSGETFFTDSTGTISVYRFGYISNSGVERGDVVNVYANVTAYDFGGSNQKIQLHSSYSADLASVVKVTDLTEQQKLDFAKLAFNFPNASQTTENILLPTSLPTGVAISWASSKPEVISTTGEVTRPDATQGGVDENVTLTATLSIGELTPVDVVIDFTVLAEGSISIADARAKAKGSIVTVEGIVTAIIGNNVFLQDDTAGIYVYNGGNANDKFVVGNEVKVAAKLDEYSGVKQLSNVTSVTLVEEEVDLPAAVEYKSVSELIEADLQGQLVKLVGVTVTEVPSGTLGGGSTGTAGSIKVTDGINTIEVRVDKYVEAFDPSTVVAVGDIINVVAPLSRYNETRQLMLTSSEDITDGTALTNADKLDVAKGSLDLGDLTSVTEDITLPTTIGGASVTWEVVEDTTVVVVNEAGDSAVVTRPAVGEADATVTLKATLSLDTETPVTKDFTVTISAMIEVVGTITDLFISEYIEGGSYNKVIEIYNGTGADVDLSVYTLELYSSGAETANQTLTLSGTLANGEVYVISNTRASADILAITDLEDSSVINFNGDDPITLSKNGVVIDVVGLFGDVDFGPDKTLVRKSTVTSGNTTYTEDEWEVLAKDTITNLGSHTIG
jgi:uncharacterized protein YdeI (BOF family)